MSSLSKQIATSALGKGYQVATTVAGPLVAVGLLASKRGRIRFAERLGRWGHFGEPLSWWFHAASVGEVQGIFPLLRKVREEVPEEVALLTCTSPTGLERAGNVVRHLRILPIDSPWCVGRAVRSVGHPQLVLTETELWPELLRQALARNIRCHIINGRISDYTVSWYRRLRSLISPLLARMSSVSVGDELQKERFIEFGVPPELVAVTGHTKYDVEVHVPGIDERDGIRRSFFPAIQSNEKLVVLGSLRPGEERLWFDAFKEAQRRELPIRLVVAPRHAERYDLFARELERRDLHYSRYSEGVNERGIDHRVLLLDAMGVLQRAYSASDLAFIGATLVDIGGHNPIEAAVYGVPVCLGPYTSVISTVVSELETAQGIVRVRTMSDILEMLERTVVAPAELQTVGLNAQRVLLRHRGASERVLSVLRHDG